MAIFDGRDSFPHNNRRFGTDFFAEKRRFLSRLRFFLNETLFVLIYVPNHDLTVDAAARDQIWIDRVKLEIILKYKI